MQCAEHPEVTATAYCSNCGSALCPDCTQSLAARILCAKCVQEFSDRQKQEGFDPPPLNSPASSSFHATPIPSKSGDPYCSPGVCFLLGLFPGVGSICNGDYFKAFLQVVVFGSLVSLAGSDQSGSLGPAFGFLTAAVYLYMPFEAYHVAKKRTLALQGITVVTPFEKIRFPDLWLGTLAILGGTVFLVNQFVAGTLAFVLRGWPLVLIGIGIYNLRRHFRP